MTTIKNINKIILKNCACGSWLNHWLAGSNSIAKRCAVCGCSCKTNLQGVHVQKTSSDALWYIIPLCSEHAKAHNELGVCDNTLFVSADPSETCEQFYFSQGSLSSNYSYQKAL